jgi:hypothetical protein
MMNWPDLFRCAEDWANGFLVGATVASFAAIALVSLVLPAYSV